MNSVTGRSESGHWGSVGFALFALTQKCSRCDAGICQQWLCQSQVCLVASAPAWKWGRAGFISKSRDLSCDMGCVTPVYCSAAIFDRFLQSFPGLSGGRHFMFHLVT